MSLGKVAQILSALFVLVTGIWSLLTVASVNLGVTGTMAITGVVGVLGLLGGLTWLGATLTSKK